jgi:putative peptide zinc metalloprotease protein
MSAVQPEQTASTTPISVAPEVVKRLQAVHAGLRSDLEVTRHVFRGQPYYVVRDPLTFQTHQFSRNDYYILISLNDTISLNDVFERLVERGLLDQDQQQEFYQFVLTLHQLGFLALPIADSRLLYQRFERRQVAARWKQIAGVLFLRIPLVNPDAFLQRTADYVRPMFTRAALCLWAALMVASMWVLVFRWDSFKSPMQSLLTNNNLLFLWIALIGLKVIHEFGHAYACKIFGGKVPEMGAFLIAFTPCAYVDASSAWGFSTTRKRVIVSLAGMYFESIVAAFALLYWNWSQDALFSSCAHKIVILSSVVTVGFNINPLMRYDGYYVLSDLVGIPNLRQRSIEFVQNVAKRWILGLPVRPSGESRRVRGLLFCYGVSSSVYKVTLVLAICGMIAMKFYLLGLGLAIFFMVSVVGTALRRLLVYLWKSTETQPVRLRAVAVSLFVIVLVPAAIAAVPVPGVVVVGGIVQTEDDHVVYARSGGFLHDVALTAGKTVHQSETLCRLTSNLADVELAKAGADVELRTLQYHMQADKSPITATAAHVRLLYARDRLVQTAKTHDQLTVTAPIQGTVTEILDINDKGRFIKKGESIATIAAGQWVVRCLVTAEQVADLRPHVGQAVRVRLVDKDVHQLAGTIAEVGVKGSRRIFSPALTQLGGGDFAVDPSTLEAEMPLFELTIDMPGADQRLLRHGSRVAVRFSTSAEPYGAYLHRRVRQFVNKLRVK